MITVSELLPFLSSATSGEPASPFSALCERLGALISKLSLHSLQNTTPIPANVADELCNASGNVITELMRGTIDNSCGWSRQGVLARLRADLVSELESIQTAMAHADPAQTSATLRQSRKRLIDLMSHVRSLEATALAKKRSFRWAIAAILALPLLVTGVAGIYLATRSGFELNSAEMHFPFRVSSPVVDKHPVLPISESDRNRFAREFSSFYFRGGGTFASHFLEMPSESTNSITPLSPLPPMEDMIGLPGPAQDGIACRLKCDIRNRRRIGTTYLSAVSLRVRLLQEQAFPWHQLDVTPQLVSTFQRNERPFGFQGVPGPMPSWSPPVFTLANEGVGPALNVKAEVRLANGELLSSSHERIIHRFPAQIFLPRPGKPISPWPLVISPPRTQLGPREFAEQFLSEPSALATKDKSPLLQFPLFAVLPEDSAIESNSTDFVHNSQRYKVLRTVADLSEYTRVYLREPLELTVDYESIAKQHFRLKRSEPELFGWCFYRRTEKVSEFDPRIERTAPPRSVQAPAHAPTTGAIEQIFSHFAPPPYEPKGVDHVTLEADLGLSQVREGEQVGQILMVDKFVNPLGTIGLYVRLRGYRTGRWQADVGVDGDTISCVEFDTLAPEVMRFPDYEMGQIDEVSRLRLHF